jgi:serine protease Do
MSSTLQQLNDEMAFLIERVSQSLVEVADGRRGGAAGTIWHPQGLIVTNAHVVSHPHAKVTLADGRALDARLLARDDDRDLAALAVNAEELPTIALGDSRSLQAGQFVMALGHPWGVNGVATTGIVMGAGARHLRIRYAEDLLAVNLPLRPGNSGGPLVDVEGRLVGINAMMTGPDTGLAVPVHVAKAFLRDKLGSA